VIEADRGFGNGARINGTVIDERPSIIEWDAGRPMALGGDGKLELNEVDVELTGAGLRLALGGRTHRLLAGSYRIDAPVAVGSVGLTTPRDAVSFTTTRGGAELVARGDAAIVLRDVTALFLGPGSVELGGDLSVTTADGTRPAGQVRLPRAASRSPCGRPGRHLGGRGHPAGSAWTFSIDGDGAATAEAAPRQSSASPTTPAVERHATHERPDRGPGAAQRLPEAHRSAGSRPGG
jgi:hypothetical protein